MRVVVGQNTIVKKITVGTPLRVGSAANGSLTGLDDVNGSVNLSDGTILQYDSASGKFLHVSPATITGSGLTVQDSGGLGSLAYDSNLAVLTYNGPSSDSIHSLFNATYDSSALGTLSYSDGTVRLTGPTAAQIRALFSAGNSLNYNETTGEFSVTVPETGASFDSDFSGKTTDDLTEGSNLYYTDSRGRAAISAIDNGGYGSLTYNNATGQIEYTGVSAAEIRGLFNVSGDLGYDTSTGVFSVDLGSVDVTDSSVTRALFSVTNDSGEYGSLSYDAGTGTFNFTRVTDSDIRGSLSADNTGNAEGFGELSFDSDRGQFSFNRIQPFEIRSLFSGAGDIQYDSGTGKFSLTVGAHYEDSDARNAFSVNFIGDTARDSSPYGDATYDPSTGELTIYGTSDSNIRGSFTVQDSGGLGSLTYIEKQGRIVYRGPDVSDVAGLLSATQDSLSMGTLTLDSSTGQFTLKLEDDSVRALFSVVSDDEGGTSLRYDQASGVFTYSGPSTLDLRSQISVRESDNTGDGSLTYDESSGVFSYIGPSPAEVRAHFAGGLGIDYNELTGTFRLDSTANIITSGIVTDTLTVNDSAVLNQATVSNRLFVDSISSIDSTQSVFVNGQSIILTSGDDGRILLDTPALHSTDKSISLNVDDSNIANIDGGGIIIGAGSNVQAIIYNATDDQFRLTSGLNVPGELTGQTIDSINKRIDELPDSAQMKSILSPGPGLSYDSINGIFRIPSSGVTAGIYGNATVVPQISVDSLGIIDSVGSIAISTVNDFTYDSATGNLKITTATDSFNVGITLDPFSTANLLEDSTNLYYTTARADSDARAALSAGIGLDYNESTGTFRIDSTADITLASAAVNQIDYNVSYSAPWKEGRVFYDSDAKAISYYNDKNDVTINVGQEFVVRVYNDTGSPLHNGRAVHYVGRMGDTPTVRLSQGNAASTARVDGVLTSTIQPGGFGYVTRLGFVNGINTNGLTEGAELYLAADSLGGFTTTEPNQTDEFLYHVGRVITEDSTEGRILVDPYTEYFEHLRVTEDLQVDSLANIPLINTDKVSFDTTRYTDINVPQNLPPFKEGNLFYFQGPDALTYSNDKINIKIGQDEVVRVYNDTGSAIPKGKVVYTTGAVNDFPTIALAKADNFDTIYETMGIASHEIGDGEFGYVTVRGLFGGLDTTGYTPGDVVHVSHDSAGELLPYMPPFPNYPYEIGTVLIADSAGGGNVGGCIQIRLKAEVFEGIRVQGNSRFDGNLTIAGDLNLLGSETQTQVANLKVADNFVFLAAGDTVTANALDSGLDDLEFIGTYQGDSDVAYFVKISNADSAGDTIVWSFDSNFSTLEPFDSAGGPTSWNLTTNGLEADLKYGVGFEFTNASGHDSGERWRGAAAPTNLDLGLIGNYNPSDGPFARAGAFRDNADGRFKFFQGYTSEITSSVNTSDSSYQDAPIQFSTGYGNIVGNLTGNVTGRVSDISNHNTSDLSEDPSATGSSGTQYFTSARARSSIFATDAGGDGSFTYDSATGEMVYTGPSEAEFYQHFKDNADSWGDLIFDSAYGNAGGGFKLHERHILRHEEVFSDSWVNTAEYFLVYSGTTGGLKKVRGDTLASTLGGGGGGAGGGLFGYINM